MATGNLTLVPLKKCFDLAAGFVSVLVLISTIRAAELPNILWIVAEDINPQLGCYGDTNAVTPNLDRFAANALRYTKCWSTAPVCAPARTALITGVYPTSTGAQHMRSLVAMPEFMRMYPQLLRGCGYYCVNNSKEDYNLEKRGKVWDESSRKAHWKNRKPGQPFFAAFNINVSHESQIRTRKGPLQHDPAKMRVPAYHPDTPEARRDWARYYDNITAMDEIAGKYLKQLADAGLADNTIVFFYGDNGGGMPRSKRWPYNSGLNVPLIIRVPEKFKHLAPRDYRPGAATDRLVDFVDFAPTLLSIAGMKPPEWMQGHAFMGWYAGAPEKYIFGFRGRMDARYDMVRSVRGRRFIYIRNYRPDLIYGQFIAYMFETPTTRVWKQLYDAGKLRPPQTYFWETKPPAELYDLQNDPDEVNNLASSPSHAGELRELRDALHRHMLETRDVGLLTESEMHRRADGTSIYDFGHDPKRYPVKRILTMANMASSLKASVLPGLKKGLKDSDSGVRYWAALGLWMRGSNTVNSARSELLNMLGDESPSVQIVAAQALARYGSANDSKPARAVLARLAPPDKNGTFVSLENLSAIEAIGPRAESLFPALRTMSRQDPKATPRTARYVGESLKHLLGEDRQ
jgi:arylsulfatase A-like enzyme